MTIIPVPEVLMCPISLDLLSDPVTLRSTGQTYDRASIQRWLLADGHRTCPVTMQPLHGEFDFDTALVPNRTLKHLVDRWLLTGCPADLSELALPALRDNLLQHQLQPSGTATTTLVVETLRIVRSLSPAGFCPLLLRLLLLPQAQAESQGHHQSMGTIEDEQEEVVELALDCLIGSPSTQELAGALHDALTKTNTMSSSFVLLLSQQQGSVKAMTGLCRVIAAAAAAAEEVRMLLGQTEQFMAALAGLVRDSSTAKAAAAEAALVAMSSLCSSEPSWATAVAAGAVDALIAYISAGPRAAKSVMTCLQTLELLLSLDAGKQAMHRHPDAAAVLVKMVFRVPSNQGASVSEHAVRSLLVACRESARLRVDAINAGLLKQLLLLLQSRCSPAAKANATALLRAVWAHHAGMLL
ncbi:U-box domain-containing protein 25-like [Phragmites australis]|uniref:U-box domain-containing protein 25-like n=1 Tax=Phragmites australis TaxID=29695 RepID=UPI002D76CE09|nr:U-box domain-containing protein 25-like [Phragmites australis]